MKLQGAAGMLAKASLGGDGDLPLTSALLMRVVGMGMASGLGEAARAGQAKLLLPLLAAAREGTQGTARGLLALGGVLPPPTLLRFGAWRLCSGEAGARAAAAAGWGGLRACFADAAGNLDTRLCRAGAGRAGNRHFRHGVVQLGAQVMPWGRAGPAQVGAESGSSGATRASVGPGACSPCGGLQGHVQGAGGQLRGVVSPGNQLAAHP